MNQRIKDILSQSVEDCMGVSTVNQEKFATNIVIDCASIVFNNFEDEEEAQRITRMMFDAYNIK